MNTKTLLAIIVVLLLIGGGYYLYARSSETGALTSGYDDASQQHAGTLDTAGQTASTTSQSASSTTITLTNDGFSPAAITVPIGTTVTWVNQSSEGMWVASAAHPTHTVYDGTSRTEHCVSGAPTSDTVFDACTSIPAGGSFSFTFTKAGTWKYHNHADAAQFGSVTVE